MMKKIKFKLIDEGHVQIYAEYDSVLDENKELLIGDIFSEKNNSSLSSHSGKNSIQICGFDQVNGAWSCARFNHSQDLCLVWNDIESFLKKKVRDRTNEEHQSIIKNKFNGSVRDYFLSMGDFKEDKTTP